MTNKWFAEYMSSHLPGWRERKCMIRKIKIRRLYESWR
jgi:hypothetical protein